MSYPATAWLALEQKHNKWQFIVVGMATGYMMIRRDQHNNPMWKSERPVWLPKNWVEA